MNCEKCQNELEAYLADRLSEGMRNLVEDHLRECGACSEEYRLMMLAEGVIKYEKEAVSNPFLSTRIMAGIETVTDPAPKAAPLTVRFLKPILITTALAAAIFFGIMTGNLYHPVTHTKEIPMELALMNDAAIESVDLLSNK